MRLFVLFSVLAVVLPRRAEADMYTDAFARAAAAERRGDLASAAHALEPAVAAYPQDYAIALRLGWTYFRAERYPDAERAYRIASQRAPASNDARLGVAMSVARQGRCDKAMPALRALFGTTVDGPAREALAACEAEERPSATLSAAGNVYLFPGHPWKQSGMGVLATAEATIYERAYEHASEGLADLAIGGAYRFVRFETASTSTLAAFSQHEGYADFGLTTKSFDLVFHGALVADGTGTYGASPHVGLSGRVSLQGDLRIDASASLYTDATVYRAAARFRLPVYGPFFVEPGIAGQDADGQAYATGSLSAILVWPSVSLWIGGKYGEEFRPAYLDAHVVYDIPEHIVFGAWAGARVHIIGKVGLEAAYAFDWLRQQDRLSPPQSGAHAFALGPVVEL
jgi:tetratricopeptide (TPR) repeat protein